MGLDMYLFKARPFDKYSFNDIIIMKDELSFLEHYEDSVKIFNDFENEYDKNLFWSIMGESDENKKERVRTQLRDTVVDSKEKYETLIKKFDSDLKKMIEEFDYDQVGYWRKANQIHAWFVENAQNNVDDCGYYEVSKHLLEKLKSVCHLTLNNKDHASTLLPTKSGFFFGGTEYDEYYLEDLKDTLKILDKVLEETDFENEVIVYSSSW